MHAKNDELYILLVSYFLLTWLSGYFGRKVINKLDLNHFPCFLHPLVFYTSPRV